MHLFLQANMVHVRIATLCLFSVVVSVVAGDSPLLLWPQPSTQSAGNTTLSIQRSKFSFDLDTIAASSQLLTAACDRYFALIFNNLARSIQVEFPTAQSWGAANDSLLSLKIFVGSANETLLLGTDETYNLTIPVFSQQSSQGLSATLYAATVFGALRGLETFSQLVHFDGSVSEIPFAPIFIADQPRYPWRGLLIDSARHFLPLWSIKHTLDAMSFSKLNVLHWHITDAESFPLQLKSQPNLALKGAWDSSAVYSATDVAEVIKYANHRGIRVVVEVDTPGHSFSWGKAFPAVVALCEKLVMSSKTYPNINSVPLDITNPLTSQVVGDVLTEISSLFPDMYIHLGGDEISFDCLDELPRIKQWMQEHLNSTNYEDLIAYHLRSSVPHVVSRGKKAIFWQEVFTLLQTLPQNNLPINPENSVIQVWFGDSDYYKLIEAAVTQGFDALLSIGWYLDQQVPSPSRKTHYMFQDTWLDFYAMDPLYGLENLTALQKERILGGEVSQWGETAHPYAFDENVWPRAAAAAEKLWSPQHLTQHANDAYSRYIRHQCRLVQRGVRASSFRPNFCPSPLLDTEIPYTQPTNFVLIPIWAIVLVGLALVLFGTMAIGFYLRSKSQPKYQQLS